MTVHLSCIHSQVVPEPLHRGRVAHFRTVGEQYGALQDHPGQLLLVQVEVRYLTTPSNAASSTASNGTTINPFGGQT